MTALSQAIADIEAAIAGATPGPWQVVDTKHPWHLPEREITGIPSLEGQFYPERSGFHTERRIFSTWNDPQLKSPFPIVNGLVGLGEDVGKPIHMVAISEEDAAYIAAVNPAAVRAILDRMATLETALGTIKDNAEMKRTLYDRYGPQWTTPQGNEYEDTSSFLTFAEEIAEIATAAITGPKETS